MLLLLHPHPPHVARRHGADPANTPGTRSPEKPPGSLTFGKVLLSDGCDPLPYPSAQLGKTFPPPPPPPWEPVVNCELGRDKTRSELGARSPPSDPRLKSG